MSTPAKSHRPKVQAAEVTYELHSLGWKAFQNLCATICGEVWGQTSQIFFDSHDGGRDGAFHGTWRTNAGEDFEGSFTTQCKFTAKADKQLHLADLADELSKAGRLAERGLSDNYFLFTNARLTGVAEEQIREAFLTIPGVKRFSAFGVDRISLIIKESSRLRMLVPRIYGLGDLSQILDERAQAQAVEILGSLGNDLGKFVITEAYQRSVKALVEHGFVLLLGEPACGKSTIAAALSVGAVDVWGCSTFKVRNADEFVRHSNPHESKQFFWIDDAFGATQFDQSSAAEWSGVFPHMNAAIRRGARVVFTSRNYIYQSARQYLKESALPVLRESQVVIQVENLSREEREQILYNHIRLGNQPAEFKSELKPFLPGIVAHPNFSPEIARRLGDPAFTKQMGISKGGVDEFVAHPVELLCEIIRTIDSGSRAALALVFMRGGQLPSPVQMTVAEERAVSLLGATISDVRNAMNALSGSLILYSSHGGIFSWRFKHPTVRDALASVIAEDHELMDIYLAGTPIDRLLDEVTCGDLGLQGVKVIIPPDRFEMFVDRLGVVDKAKWEIERRTHHFLASRCSSEFLLYYATRHPTFISKLRVGSYLYAVSDVDVIVRLHEFGLLPEAKRISAINQIRNLAIETPDAGFLRKRIRGLLTKEEFAAILECIRTELIPNLDGTIEDWRGNYDKNGSEGPDVYFDELVSALRDYRDELVEQPADVDLIESALGEIDSIIDELQSERPEGPDYHDFRGSQHARETYISVRSVFDDVDQ